jgi:hypothetical protein
MRKLTKVDLDTAYLIYFTVFPRNGRETLTGSLDRAVADLFEIEEKPFSTSLEASYELLDGLVINQNDDYTNVDFREYRNEDGTFSHIICDINEDSDGVSLRGSGTAATRGEALFQAVVSAFTVLVEND